MEYIVVMKILICGFGEGIWLWHTNLACRFLQFLKHQSVIYCVYHASFGFRMRTQQVLRDSLSIRETASFIIVVGFAGSWLAFAHDLRFGAELKSFILRVIFNDSLVFVKGSQVFILIRIRMLVKRVKSLIGSVHYF